MTTCETYEDATGGSPPISPEAYVTSNHNPLDAETSRPTPTRGSSAPFPLRTLSVEFPKVVEQRSPPNGRPPKVPSSPAPTHPLNKNGKNEDSCAVVVSLENFERVPRVKGVLNSPRSLKACKMEDVFPADLLQRNVTDFMGPGVPEDIARLRHTVFEKRRKERLERVCRVREQLVAEGKGTEELAGVREMKTPQGAVAEMKREVGDTNGHRRPSTCMSNHHGGTSRSSSVLWKQGCSPLKASSSRRGRSAWHRPESRSTSMGAMLIYSRAISEHRSPSEKEIAMIERIEEREQRIAEVRQRMELEEKDREQELLRKQLNKMRKIVNNMVEKEATRNAAINSKRLKWEEQMMRIRERQKRDGEARESQMYTRGGRAATQQGSGVSGAPLLGDPRKERGHSLSSIKMSSC